MIIYHVTTPDYYKEFENQDHFYPEGLQYEGFIHCSYERQLPHVLGRYYKNEENVVILKIDTDQLRAEVKIEMATMGDKFPHIYGMINEEAIMKVIKMQNHYYQQEE